MASLRHSRRFHMGDRVRVSSDSKDDYEHLRGLIGIVTNVGAPFSTRHRRARNPNDYEEQFYEVQLQGKDATELILESSLEPVLSL